MPRVPAVCQIYSAYSTQHGHIDIHSHTLRHTHSVTAATLVKMDRWMDRWAMRRDKKKRWEEGGFKIRGDKEVRIKGRKNWLAGVTGVRKWIFWRKRGGEERERTDWRDWRSDCLDVASWIFLTIFSCTFLLKPHFNFVIFVSCSIPCSLKFTRFDQTGDYLTIILDHLWSITVQNSCLAQMCIM